MFDRVYYPNTYIEFSDSGMRLSTLHKKGKKFFVRKNERTLWLHQEMTGGVPINLSSIFSLVRKCIKEHKIVNPNAIIVCKGLEDKPAFLQKSISLQLALCCIKAGVNVHKIIGERLF